jgi:hypothetical protein
MEAMGTNKALASTPHLIKALCESLYNVPSSTKDYSLILVPLHKT